MHKSIKLLAGLLPDVTQFSGKSSTNTPECFRWLHVGMWYVYTSVFSIICVTGWTTVKGVSKKNTVYFMRLICTWASEAHILWMLIATMTYPTNHQEGKSALPLASERGHIDVMKVLIERGADVNAQDWVMCICRSIHHTWTLLSRICYTVAASGLPVIHE